MHDIGVEWHSCTQPGCGYRAKRNCDLTEHLARKHDIGVYSVECYPCTEQG